MALWSFRYLPTLRIALGPAKLSTSGTIRFLLHVSNDFEFSSGQALIRADGVLSWSVARHQIHNSAFGRCGHLHRRHKGFE
jgi:hypothetical protein